MMGHHTATFGWIGSELLAAAGAFGTYFQLIPSALAPIAVVMGVLWYSLNIMDWFEDRREKRVARLEADAKLARLRIEEAAEVARAKIEVAAAKERYTLLDEEPPDIPGAEPKEKGR